VTDLPDPRNPNDVKVGQVWKDNDARLAEREFEVVLLDLDYYPKGRVRCKLLGELKKGQRALFYVRLDRFNGTKRGYSMTKDVEKPKPKPKTKKKKAKKKAKRGKS